MNKASTEAGLGPIVQLVYEPEKTTYRSEVDKVFAEQPEFLYLGCYTPDTIILIRERYRAGYTGKIVADSCAIDETALAALPAEVTEGMFTYGAIVAEGSPSYLKALELLGADTLDPYVAQSYDHAALAVLALAASGTDTGEGIRDNLRRVAQGDGVVVSSAVEGIEVLAGGGKINYDGASGELTFNDIGDITSVRYRYSVVKNGKFENYKES